MPTAKKKSNKQRTPGSQQPADDAPSVAATPTQDEEEADALEEKKSWREEQEERKLRRRLRPAVPVALVCILPRTDASRHALIDQCVPVLVGSHEDAVALACHRQGPTTLARTTPRETTTTAGTESVAHAASTLPDHATTVRSKLRSSAVTSPTDADPTTMSSPSTALSPFSAAPALSKSSGDAAQPAVVTDEPHLAAQQCAHVNYAVPLQRSSAPKTGRAYNDTVGSGSTDATAASLSQRRADDEEDGDDEDDAVPHAFPPELLRCGLPSTAQMGTSALVEWGDGTVGATTDVQGLSAEEEVRQTYFMHLLPRGVVGPLNVSQTAATQSTSISTPASTPSNVDPTVSPSAADILSMGPPAASGESSGQAATTTSFPASPTMTSQQNVSGLPQPGPVNGATMKAVCKEQLLRFAAMAKANSRDAERALSVRPSFSCPVSDSVVSCAVEGTGGDQHEHSETFMKSRAGVLAERSEFVAATEAMRRWRIHFARIQPLDEAYPAGGYVAVPAPGPQQAHNTSHQEGGVDRNAESQLAAPSNGRVEKGTSGASSNAARVGIPIAASALTVTPFLKNLQQSSQVSLASPTTGAGPHPATEIDGVPFGLATHLRQIGTDVVVPKISPSSNSSAGANASGHDPHLHHHLEMMTTQSSLTSPTTTSLGAAGSSAKFPAANSSSSPATGPCDAQRRPYVPIGSVLSGETGTQKITKLPAERKEIARAIIAEDEMLEKLRYEAALRRGVQQQMRDVIAEESRWTTAASSSDTTTPIVNQGDEGSSSLVANSSASLSQGQEQTNHEANAATFEYDATPMQNELSLPCGQWVAGVGVDKDPHATRFIPAVTVVEKCHAVAARAVEEVPVMDRRIAGCIELISAVVSRYTPVQSDQFHDSNPDINLDDDDEVQKLEAPAAHGIADEDQSVMETTVAPPVSEEPAEKPTRRRGRPRKSEIADLLRMHTRSGLTATTDDMAAREEKVLSRSSKQGQADRNQKRDRSSASQTPQPQGASQLLNASSEVRRFHSWLCEVEASPVGSSAGQRQDASEGANDTFVQGVLLKLFGHDSEEDLAGDRHFSTLPGSSETLFAHMYPGHCPPRDVVGADPSTVRNGQSVKSARRVGGRRKPPMPKIVRASQDHSWCGVTTAPSHCPAFLSGFRADVDVLEAGSKKSRLQTTASSATAYGGGEAEIDRRIARALQDGTELCSFGLFPEDGDDGDAAFGVGCSGDIAAHHHRSAGALKRATGDKAAVVYPMASKLPTSHPTLSNETETGAAINVAETDTTRGAEQLESIPSSLAPDAFATAGFGTEISQVLADLEAAAACTLRDVSAPRPQLKSTAGTSSAAVRQARQGIPPSGSGLGLRSSSFISQGHTSENDDVAVPTVTTYEVQRAFTLRLWPFIKWCRRAVAALEYVESELRAELLEVLSNVPKVADEDGVDGALDDSKKSGSAVQVSNGRAMYDQSAGEIATDCSWLLGAVESFHDNFSAAALQVLPSLARKADSRSSPASPIERTTHDSQSQSSARRDERAEKIKAQLAALSTAKGALVQDMEYQSLMSELLLSCEKIALDLSVSAQRCALQIVWHRVRVMADIIRIRTGAPDAQTLTDCHRNLTWYTQSTGHFAAVLDRGVALGILPVGTTEQALIHAAFDQSSSRYSAAVATNATTTSALSNLNGAKASEVQYAATKLATTQLAQLHNVANAAAGTVRELAVVDDSSGAASRMQTRQSEVAAVPLTADERAVRLDRLHRLAAAASSNALSTPRPSTPTTPASLALPLTSSREQKDKDKKVKKGKNGNAPTTTAKDNSESEDDAAPMASVVTGISGAAAVSGRDAQFLPPWVRASGHLYAQVAEQERRRAAWARYDAEFAAFSAAELADPSAGVEGILNDGGDPDAIPRREPPRPPSFPHPDAPQTAAAGAEMQIVSSSDVFPDAEDLAQFAEIARESRSAVSGPPAARRGLLNEAAATNGNGNGASSDAASSMAFAPTAINGAVSSTLPPAAFLTNVAGQLQTTAHPMLSSTEYRSEVSRRCGVPSATADGAIDASSSCGDRWTLAGMDGAVGASETLGQMSTMAGGPAVPAAAAALPTSALVSAMHAVQSDPRCRWGPRGRSAGGPLDVGPRKRPRSAAPEDLTGASDHSSDDNDNEGAEEDEENAPIEGEEAPSKRSFRKPKEINETSAALLAKSMAQPFGSRYSTIAGFAMSEAARAGAPTVSTGAAAYVAAAERLLRVMRRTPTGMELFFVPGTAPQPK